MGEERISATGPHDIKEDGTFDTEILGKGENSGEELTYLTPDQQKYRADLESKIRVLESLGEEGKKLAKELCETLQDDPKYIKSKGRTLDGLFDDVEKDMTLGDRRDFMATLSVLYKALGDNKTELTEQQKETLRIIIRFGFDKRNRYKSYENSCKGDLVGSTVAVNFMNQNFDVFTQEERENLVLCAIKKIDITIWDHYNPGSDVDGFNTVYSYTGRYSHKPTGFVSNGIDYYFSSKWTIRSMVEKTLAESKNENFIFDMLPYLAKEKTFFDIPENCKAIYSDGEKFKNYIVSENKKLEETALRTHYLFPFFDYLGIIITRDIADLLRYKPFYSYGMKEGIIKLSEKIIQKESVKTALNSEMGGIKEGELERFRQYFSSEYIWKLLDDKYKMPDFVNSHIGALKSILMDVGIETLIEEFGKLVEGKTLTDFGKFDRSVFEFYLDYNQELEPDVLDKIWRITNLNTLKPIDFGLISHGLYDFVEKEGLLGTDYLDSVLKGYGYPGTHSVYYMLKSKGDVSKDFLEKVLDNDQRYAIEILSAEEATDFMQDVYATQDENLVKKLFNKIGRFAPHCSQEDINVLIRKMINVISSQEDFEIFVKKMDDCAYYGKCSMFLKIKYLLTNSLNMGLIQEYDTKIPSDIYIELIKSGVINLDRKYPPLPKVYQKPSPFIDPDDLNKLSNYYNEMLEKKRQMDKKREQEEEDRQARLRQYREESERIYSEAIKNREKGEVIFDDYVKDSIFQGQKYVLSVDRKNHILKFVTAPMDKFPFHSDLHYKYVEDGRCLGGGLIDKNDEKKVITLRGDSKSYGSVGGENREVMKKMLEKKFPDYEIYGI